MNASSGRQAATAPGKTSYASSVRFVTAMMVVSVASGAFAATGTWNNTGTGWSSAGSWTGGIPNGSSDIAAFNVAAISQPNLSASVTVQRLAFTADTSSGYVLTRNGSETLTVAGVGTTSTTAAIEFNNTGTNTLNVPIIFSAPAASTVRIYQDDGSDPTPSNAILNGNISDNNGIAGIYLDGDDPEENIFTFAGTNTYSGSTTIEASTLNLASAAALPANSTVVTLSLESTLNNVTGSTITLQNNFVVISNVNFGLYSQASTIHGSNANFILNGNMDLTIGGAINVEDVTTGTFTPAHMTVTTNGTLDLGNQQVQKGGEGVLILNGAIANGAGEVMPIGSGPEMVNYTSSFRLNSGTVEMGTNAALGSGTIEIRAATLRAGSNLTGANAIPNKFVISALDPTIGGSNNIEFTGDFINNGDAGDTSVVITNTGSTTWSGTVSITDHPSALDIQTFTFEVAGTAGPTEISGTIQDHTATGFASSLGHFHKGGTGTLLLSGANTYVGETRVLAGTLQLTGSLNPSTVIRLGQSVTGDPVGKFILGGVAGPVNQTIGGLNSVGGGTTNQLVGGNPSISTLTINSTGNSTYAGSLGGVSGNDGKLAVVKAGFGVVTITGTNNTAIAGPLTITGGGVSFAGNGTTVTASAGAVSLSDGTSLGVKVGNTGTTRLSSSSLSLGTSTLSFDFNGLGNPTVPIIASSGALSVPGTAVTISTSNIANLNVGTIALIDYAGAALSGADFAKFTQSFNLTGRRVGTLVNDTANTKLSMNITAAVPVWRGSISSDWDRAEGPGDTGGTLNFRINNGATATAYQEQSLQGDSVLFADTYDGINAPLTTNVVITEAVNPTAVTVNNSSLDYTFSGPAGMSGPMTLTKSGSGTLTIASTNTYTGTTTVNAGTLKITAAGALPTNAAVVNHGTFEVAANSTTSSITGTGTTNVTAGTLISNGAIQQGTLAVSNSATARISAGASLSTVDTINLNTTGTLDLNDNDLVVVAGSAAYATVNAKLGQGYNFGGWNGTGIRSTSALGAGNTALGILTGQQFLDNDTLGAGTFSGYTIATLDLLVKYSYQGDNNLDGAVDDADLFLFLPAYTGAQGGDWLAGDYTYDGFVDDADLFLFLPNYTGGATGLNAALSSLGLEPTAAILEAESSGLIGSAWVPEPASLSLVAIGSGSLLRRRKRGHLLASQRCAI